MSSGGQTSVELRVRDADWRRLMAHLFPGDRDEHGAVLLCGEVRTARGLRLLVREVVLARDGADYEPGVRGYRHLTGEFVTHQVRRAKDLGLVYLAVHNHGGRDEVAFSRPDLASHERGYPTLLKLTGRAVGALVCAPNAVAGDIWTVDGTRVTLERTVIVGKHRQVVTPGRDDASGDRTDRFHRQTLLFGEEGQAILRTSRVAVVGCGGVGMLLVQYLSRLGVGDLIVIDPDRVEPTNLPRLPETTRRDAMELLDREGRPAFLRRLARRFARPKVRVARRIARRANPNVELEHLREDVVNDATARRLRDVDFIFLAADTMLARQVVNQLAYQYLIPTLQVGSKIVTRDGSVTDVFGVVRHLGVEPGCLQCNGLIDFVALAEEALGDPEQVARQRYVDDPRVHAPSVITVNALGSGFAANDFMLHTVGIGGAEPAHRVIRNAPVGSTGVHVTVVDPNANSGCPVCSVADNSALARGDALELPTRVGVRT